MLGSGPQGAAVDVEGEYVVEVNVMIKVLLVEILLEVVLLAPDRLENISEIGSDVA